MAGSRRASRLKDPCGFPSNTEADVVYRVSGGHPPKARAWKRDDVSEAQEHITIIKDPYNKRYRPQVLIQDGSMGRIIANSLSTADLLTKAWVYQAPLSGGCRVFLVSLANASARSCHTVFLSATEFPASHR